MDEGILRAKSAVNLEADDLENKQSVRYKFAYPQMVAVPNNGQRQAQLVVDEDADFYAERITGSCLGPTDMNGIRLAGQQSAVQNPNVPPQPTNFPFIGTSTGYADRGLMVRIFEGGSTLMLTDGYVPVELIFTPGYDPGTFHIPFPFKYYVKRNSKMVFDFINRDQAVPQAVVGYNTPSILFHFVGLSLDGYKYLTTKNK